MKGGKLLKLFSKGAKKGSKSGGKKSGGGFSWPSGIRIGVFGHANSGKTVYFTVLNEDCKVARDFQLSVTDTVTAGEFLSNYRHLWGIGTATSVGTVVDLKGEKKFPDPTSSDKVLRFNAILHRKDKLPVVCYDYPGKTVEIAETGEAKEKLMDFMTHCQGLLFFFDPKMMAAELLCQQHVASFVNMLDTLAPAGSRLPIPVALVVSKADLLDGFSGEQQSILVSPEDENFLANDFELFLEKVLSSDTLSSSLTWSGSVRRVLVQLREFLKVVVGRTLDFQIFFMSSTGVTPEKVGTDVGRSLYIPPDKMQPIGVRHPFYWLFTSILRNRRISRMRTVAKYVTLISLIWIATFSTPFLYNLSFRLPRLFQEENGILIKYQGDPYKFSSKERSKIKRSYERYKNDFLIKMIFPEYWTPANDIYDLYFRGERDLAQTTADKELDKLTETFSAIVSDSGRWPNIEPATGEPSLGPEHTNLANELNQYCLNDSLSVHCARAKRTLKLWSLFLKAITIPSDTLPWHTLSEQVDFNSQEKLTKAESRLGGMLQSASSALTQQTTEIDQRALASASFDNLASQIESITTPAYRLGKAAKSLKKLKQDYSSALSEEQLADIDRYLRAARKWKTRQTFHYTPLAVSGGHLHIEVVSKGQKPSWTRIGEILEGYPDSLNWHVGDQIYIAFDTFEHECLNGRKASEQVLLDDKYSIFEVDRPITFPNIGKTVTIKMDTDLNGLLPRLKEGE